MQDIRMESLWRTQMNQEHSDQKILYHESSSTTLPKIGSRVRRGPDWCKNDQDGNGPGTVVGHSEEGKHCLHLCFSTFNNLFYINKGFVFLGFSFF